MRGGGVAWPVALYVTQKMHVINGLDGGNAVERKAPSINFALLVREIDSEIVGVKLSGGIFSTNKLLKCP
jgi:hypothetical protein